jgi:glucose/arabinose dehydrogenase
MVRRGALLAILMLAGCGGGGGSGATSPPPPPPPPPPTNLAPVITIASTATFAEGGDAAVDFTINDPEGVRPTLLTLAGEDAAEFQLSSGGTGNTITGTLHLRGPDSQPPDYEWPTDVGRDNVYNVTVRASDGVDTTTRDVRFTITNLIDTPVVTRIGTGFDELVALATKPPNQNTALSVPGGSDMLGVVAERKGMIYAIRDNRSVDRSKPFLDITSEVSIQNGMGILGVAIFDEGAFWGLGYANVELFVLMSNLQGDTELRQYLIKNDWTADKATMSLVLKVAQPPGVTGNRGGMLVIANNRMLVGIGDGGGTGDPAGNAQNLNSFLGKVLRINPNGDGFPSDPNRNYMIPSDNPMLNGVRQEIWATGLRNPVQGAFDPRGLYTYILDAGEGGVDEVNRLPWQPASVVNFGWPQRLGVNTYNGGADDPAFMKPVVVYAAGASAAARRMSAGVIYWGRAEAHQGEFSFGDTMNDQLQSFRIQTLLDGQALTTFNNITTDLTPDTGRIDAPVAIMSDDRRDMFILDSDGEIFRYHKAGT